MALKRITHNYPNIINLLLVFSLIGLLPIIDHADDIPIEQTEQVEQIEQDAQAEQNQGEQTEKETDASKVVSLHELTNEDLLQQFQQTLDAAQNRLQMILRMLKETEFLLERAKNDVLEVKLPSEPDVKDLSPADADKQHLEYRQAMVEALKQQLEAQEAEKTLLDQYSKQLSSAYTDMGTLLQDSEAIDYFVLQVKLRVDDGSLPKASVSEQFTATWLEGLRQSFSDEQTRLTEEIEALKKTAEELTKVLDETKKNVIEAESAQQTAQERYDQGQKRQELEKDYAKKSPKKLFAELTELLEERAWLQSTIAASLRNFLAQRAVEEKIAKELEAMIPPERTDEEALSDQSADTDQYFKELDTYHRNRLNVLKTHRDALETLIKKGELLEGDARVTGEYIFRIQMIVGIFERLSAEKNNSEIVLSPEMTSEAIKKYDAELSARLSEASAAVTYAKEQLIKIAQLQTQSMEAIAQAEQSLVNLKKTREAMLAIQKWETELKGLTAEQVVTKFTETTKSLEEKSKILEKERTDFAQVENAYTEAMSKFETLQDPFARELQTKKQGEQRKLLEQLYQFAGLEPPEPEVVVSEETTDGESDSAATASTTVAPAASAPTIIVPDTTVPATTAAPSATAVAIDSANEATGESATPSQPTPAPAEPEEDPDAAIIAYQGQLSGWLHITDEQGKQRTEMLNILKKFDTQMTSYLAILDQVYQLTQQQQATAMEVKKRVGRAELSAEKIPEGITAALKRDQITILEAERVKVRNQQSLAQDEIANLSQKDEVLPEINKLFENANMLTGKLLDALQQANKLAQDFALAPDALDSVERKTLEQSASRRIRSENSIPELFFSFFESQEISILTEILQAYYLELTELEGKQEILLTQQGKYENAILYLQEEKKAMTQLLLLLQDKLTALQNIKEEETIKAKARIAPDRAKELLVAFESEKGRALTIPSPLAEEDKAIGIGHFAKHLFDLDIQIQALEEWIDLFNERILPSGIDVEIGQYQDIIAELHTKDAALQRRIATLIGYTPEAIAQLTKEEKPTTRKGWARIKVGEIGVLRAERLELYKENIYMIGVKVTMILISSMIVIFFLNLFIKRLLSRAQRDIDSGERTDTSLISVLMLLRKVSKFFIVGTTFILCLDAMGFNTGAILAGLGIGGIGIAMASKDILSDIFGGITIMIMGLYKIGDLISFKGTWYIVKEIGIRHTVLEDFSYNYRVSMPNGKLIESEIANVSSHSGHAILKNLHLATTNQAEKLRQALALIEEIVTGHPGARFIWVKHHHFDDYSFVLRLHYDIRKFKERNRVESDINAEIVKRFQENEIKFTPLPGFSPELLGK